MIFVTGRTKRSIEDHFDALPDLERELLEKGKDAVVQAVRDIVPNDVNFIFILRVTEDPRFKGLTSQRVAIQVTA